MHYYSAYGFRVCSELVLPELIPSDDSSTPDVVIHRRPLPASEAADVVHGDDCFVGEVPGLLTFLVERGRRIIVDPLPELDDGILRTILLGPILGILLRQRTLLPLHASSVIIDGGVVAFMGDSGMGKSTLAQVCLARGFQVVADDITALQVSADAAPLVVPGYPQLKLLPDVVERFVEANIALPMLHSATTKRTHLIPEGFAQDPVPLRKIYVLDVGEESRIETLKPTESFPLIIQHTRAIFLLKGAKYATAHFQQATQLIKQVRVARFIRKHSLDEVPASIQLILDDLACEDDRMAA